MAAIAIDSDAEVTRSQAKHRMAVIMQLTRSCERRLRNTDETEYNIRITYRNCRRTTNLRKRRKEELTVTYRFQVPFDVSLCHPSIESAEYRNQISSECIMWGARVFCHVLPWECSMSGSRWMCTLLGLIDEYSGDLLQRVKKGSLFIQWLCLVNLQCMMFILVICEHCYVHFFFFPDLFVWHQYKGVCISSRPSFRFFFWWDFEQVLVC